MFQMIMESDSISLLKNGLDEKKFNSTLRAICLDTNFKESSPNHYYLEEEYDELDRMIILKIKFDKLGYIIPNLSKWITCSDEYGELNRIK